jgi:hypothetical protein
MGELLHFIEKYFTDIYSYTYKRAMGFSVNKEILLKYFIFLLKSVYSLTFSFSNTQLYMIKFSCFSFDPRTTRVRLIGRSRTDIQFISIHIYSKTSHIWTPSGLFQIAHLTKMPRISGFLLIT